MLPWPQRGPSVVPRYCSHVDCATLCHRCTCEAALLRPAAIWRSVPKSRWHGGVTAEQRCDSIVACAPARNSAFCLLPPSFSLTRSRRSSSSPKPIRALVQFFPTKCCCAVSGPDWARRGRLRTFRASLCQSPRCSSVNRSLVLHAFEAAPKAARARNCAAVRGSLGLTHRRRCCLLPLI
jgi:hypothetical protein